MFILNENRLFFIKQTVVIILMAASFKSIASDTFANPKKVDLSNSTKTVDDSGQKYNFDTPTSDKLFSTTPGELKSNSTNNSETPSETAASGGFSEKSNIESNKPPSTFPRIMQACMLQSQIAQQALSDLCKKSADSAKSCSENFVPAGTLCNPDSNSSVLQQVALIQGLLSTAQGLTDSCSAFSKAMSLGKAAMAAFTTGCSIKRQICDSSCSSSVKLVKEVGRIAKSIKPQLATTSCLPNSPTYAQCTPETNDKERVEAIIKLVEEETQDTAPTVASKLKTCATDMVTLLGMGAANIAALAQSKSMSDECDKETSATTAATAVDCTKAENKTKTECASTVVDCGLTANADKPICICKANPRVTGCEGISTALATNSTMSTGSDGTTSGRGANGKLTAAPGAATDKKFPADLSKTSKNDGSSIGGGGGGSTAGLSANSDVGSSDGTKLEKSENAGNANILSNESGGGGGGYRFGFGGSSGSKAQLRKLAGDNGFKGKLTAQDWSAQVTSNGGKSNFDKVKVRYIENRTSLLNR
jgi:hypothetical protein